ncbi:MAG TPA: prolyl oligopeptidase family serine peptidase [Thermoleophilia bacterium]|nr:prolyl oligopeptidase family serine peptidase [Thermoleophilia bacterium]
MTAEKTAAAYGSWRSPITASLLAEAGVALGQLQTAAGRTFWLEMRPLEGGRSALVQQAPDGTIVDVTPAHCNARTLVHEYGGGSYTLFDDGERVTVIFSEFEDQRLYQQDVDAYGSATVPEPITPVPTTPRALRYADGRVTPDGRTLICVRERHDDTGVVNELVAVPTASAPDSGGAEPRVLAGGRDFYAAPRISSDGRTLAWLCWDHPEMPWDGTELWVADLTAAGLGAARRVAGGPAESIVQPAWSADGRLHFISDRSGWWNLYRVDEPDSMLGIDETASTASAIALAPLAAEFAKPAWAFGLRSYAFLDDGRIVCIFSQDGIDRLALIEPDRPGVQPIPCSFTTFSSIVATGEAVAVIGGSATQGSTVALLDPTNGEIEPIRQGRPSVIDLAYLSRPEPVAFPTSYEPGSIAGPLLGELEAAGGELQAHALYYPAANLDFRESEGERPPLIVMSHGGPTSARETLLDLGVQFWTSRGVAVVDVNYGGSTGYGRAYRQRLKGNWGIVDTIDCINAARHLVARGDVDPARIAIQGGSAGGYTTLNALTRHRFFAAGASYFGLADLELFASGGTHKFESQYLTGLVGPYPELAAVYRERSPIQHVRGISCPLILLQGLEDAIVPPAQAEIIVAALQANGLPYAYLTFAGEQHGFRKAESNVRAEEAVLSFYGRVFGFTPADDLEPLHIENLG